MQTIETVSRVLEQRVSAAMTTEVRYAYAEATVAEVVDMMAEHDLRRIVIVDRQKKVLGVVSQRDVLRHLFVAEHQNNYDGAASGDDAEIQALISREKPLTLSPDAPLGKAAMVLATNRIGCLPVVDAGQELKGVLSVSDLFRLVAGRSRHNLEAEFKLYSPGSDGRATLPAYIRRMNGDLVIPVACLEDPDSNMQLAVLGYDEGGGRILVKFVEPGSTPVRGAIKTKQDKENLTIPAGEFVAHFHLGGAARTFDVSSSGEGRYLVLTPK